MDELGKISRVIDRELPGCDRETLLVLDATTGQNGLIPVSYTHLVYLDGGIGSARKIIQRFILDCEEEKSASRDYKTALQELVQRESGQVLGYRLIGAEGPDHAKVFSVEVDLNGAAIGQGQGRSKKEAEQAAAKAAIEKLKG